MPPTRTFLQQGRWTITWTPTPSARRIHTASQHDQTLYSKYNAVVMYWLTDDSQG